MAKVWYRRIVHWFSDPFGEQAIKNTHDPIIEAMQETQRKFAVVNDRYPHAFPISSTVENRQSYDQRRGQAMNTILHFLGSTSDFVTWMKEVSLILAILLSVALSLIMFKLNPFSSLEKSILFREITLILLFARLFVSVYFDLPPQTWGLLVYFATIVASLLVLYNIVDEYFFKEKQ